MLFIGRGFSLLNTKVKTSRGFFIRWFLIKQCGRVDSSRSEKRSNQTPGLDVNKCLKEVKLFVSFHVLVYRQTIEERNYNKI